MVKIIRPTLLTKAKHEAVLGFTVISFVVLTLLFSVFIALLNVKVSNLTASNNFKYMVTANGKTFELVPSDILRIDRTQARRGVTGQEVIILKIYTDRGFIYATPSDEFYNTAVRLANAVDVTGGRTYVQDGVSWNEVQQKAYAIGTSPDARSTLFALRGIQNICLLITGFSLLALIFPLRPEQEEDSSRVVTRMEQLA